MKKLMIHLSLLCLLAAVALPMVSCGPREEAYDNDNAENAAEAVEEAADDMGDAMEEDMGAMEEGMEEMGDEMEDAADHMGDHMEDAADEVEEAVPPPSS